jgi:hypothetical protein
MPPDYDQIFGCLDEFDRELLRVGADECNFLQQQSQLIASAFSCAT